MFEETYKNAIKEGFTMNFDNEDDKEVDTASDDGK